MSNKNRIEVQIDKGRLQFGQEGSMRQRQQKRTTEAREEKKQEK